MEENTCVHFKESKLAVITKVKLLESLRKKISIGYEKRTSRFDPFGKFGVFILNSVVVVV